MQHGGGQAVASVVVEAADRQAGRGVLGIGDIGSVFFAGQAVLGGEDCREFDAGGAHDIDIAVALAIETGLIGDQADALARRARRTWFASMTSSPVSTS